MAYQNNIPQATDQLSVSQADILNNFAALSTFLNINHVDFASGDQGKHKWVTLPVQTPSPPIAFGAGEVAIYSFLNPTTSQNELYINKTNQVTVKQIPATASILSLTSAPASNAGGWTYLPSGLLLKFGSSAGTLSGLVTVTPTDGPAFTQMLTVLVTPYNGTSTGDLNFAVRLVDINAATTFRVYFSSRTGTGAASGQTGLQFLAIGY